MQFVLDFLNSTNLINLTSFLKQISKSKEKLHILNLRFFYSNLKEFYSFKNIIFVSKKIIYREIFIYLLSSKRLRED